MSSLKVACLGSDLGQPGEPPYEAMRMVGRSLARAGYTVMTGGCTGVGSEAPARGAREAGGRAIGVTFLGMSGNPHLSSTIDCSTVGGISLSLEEQLGLHLGTLLTADAFIVAAGGGLGTLVELLAILKLHTKHWGGKSKKVVVLRTAYSGPGWDYGMVSTLARWCGTRADLLEVYFVQTPHEAVKIITP